MVDAVSLNKYAACFELLFLRFSQCYNSLKMAELDFALIVCCFSMFAG